MVKPRTPPRGRMRRVLSTTAVACVLFAGTVALGAGKSDVPTVFEPSTDGVVTYYSGGRPYGVFARSGMSFIVHLDNATVASKEYARLWIYCRNDSVPVADFDPANWLTHTITTQQEFELGFAHVNWIKYTVLPVSPLDIPSHKAEPAWSLINRIKAQAARAELWSILGASLSGLATALAPPPDSRVSWQSDGAGGGSGSITIHDSQEKTEARMRLTAGALALNLSEIRAAAREDQVALNQTVLRRDTLVPGMAVAGFAYFPQIQTVQGRVIAEKTSASAVSSDTLLRTLRVDRSTCGHIFKLRLPDGETMEVQFKAVASR